MSSYNSFYRYQIESASDLTNSTFQRRTQKAAHNDKLSFFYEVLLDQPDSEAIKYFFERNLKQNDLVFLKPQRYSDFGEQIKNDCLYVVLEDESDLTYFNKVQKQETKLLLIPKDTKTLKLFVDFYLKNQTTHKIFWRFLPYDENIRNSITVADINHHPIEFSVLAGLEIYNSKAPKHYELQPQPKNGYSIKWASSISGSKPLVSVIIPTYNNGLFLSNVVWHLTQQNFPKENYEIIIADDGSQDNSVALLQEIFLNLQGQFNLTYIYWDKTHPVRGEQFFFRSGLARNLGTRYSKGDYLIFLDSDMIVPHNFIETAAQALKTDDLIQFQRFHINQELSKKNPSYQSVNLKVDTYIEEKNYWSLLFFSDNWSSLRHYWKFTCTYALGIKRKDFFNIGMFKKYYVSYGFEDTDLGYEAHKRKLKFRLVKMPLLHLTAYNQMQYKNSFRKRVRLLRVTAELFYLQHLEKEIYDLLGDYLRMQKPLKAFFRDLIS